MRDLRELTDQERVLEAVLIFFEGGVWDHDKHLWWFTLTGQTEVTTRVLCDLIRKVLGKA